MHSTCVYSAFLILTVAFALEPSPASARINVNLQADYTADMGFVFSTVERWDAKTGQKVFRYEILDGFGGTPESVDAITMGPDGYLYAAGNNLGSIDVVRLNTANGTTVTPPDYDCCGIGVRFATFVGGPLEDMVFDSHGDLLTAATNYPQGVGGSDQGVIRRFDGTTGLPKGELVVGLHPYVYSIDASSDGSYFFAMHTPISVGPGDDPSRYLTKYLYSSLNNVFTEVASFAITGSYINVGPDGLLYVGNAAADSVDRYNANGQFLDQFIDEYVFDLHWLEGKLIALSTDSRVVEIDPTNGLIVSTLIDANDYSGPGKLGFYGMAAFSVAPEPNSACLLMYCLTVMVGRKQSRKRH